MVKNNLTNIVMARMAIDIAAGMHYLSDAGFVVRGCIFLIPFALYYYCCC